MSKDLMSVGSIVASYLAHVARAHTYAYVLPRVDRLLNVSLSPVNVVPSDGEVATTALNGFATELIILHCTTAMVAQVAICSIVALKN